MGSKRLPRDAAERVLRRAVELGDQPGDADDSFDVEVLIQAAGDLGVPGTAVQRALAEEQAGLLVGESSRLDRLAGPAAISVARVVELDSASALELTDEWLRRQWAFKRVRAGDTVAEYRRRTDMVASMQRTARSMSGKENAEKVRNLRVVVRDLPTETGSSGAAIVAVVVDLETSKVFAEMGAGVVAGGGTLMSTVATVTNDSVGLIHAWPLLGIPASAVMGAGVLVARRAWTGGIDVALEGLLDQVEARESPPTVIRGLTGRLFGGSQQAGTGGFSGVSSAQGSPPPDASPGATSSAEEQPGTGRRGRYPDQDGPGEGVSRPG